MNPTNWMQVLHVLQQAPLTLSTGSSLPDTSSYKETVFVVALCCASEMNASLTDSPSHGWILFSFRTKGKDTRLGFLFPGESFLNQVIFTTTCKKVLFSDEERGTEREKEREKIIQYHMAIPDINLSHLMSSHVTIMPLLWVKVEWNIEENLFTSIYPLVSNSIESLFIL